MASSRYASYIEEEDWDIQTLELVNAHLENVVKMLPGGGADLTLAELQGLAARQQVAMETQQQALVARETRLKYLQQQEARHRQLASEQARLQRMKERVEAQELKLKKLRALRGQVDQYKASNGNLNTELEAVRALFNEKEKELAMAVSKVDQLMCQLQDLRDVKAKGVITNGNKSENMTLELEKLRNELTHRHKQNEQQHSRLEDRRQLLQQRKEEVTNMDNRIHELQQRLKKRRFQQQQEKQNVSSTTDQKSNKLMGSASGMGQRKTGQNIAAVEPYVQYAPRDVSKDDLYSKAAFLKHDPKYQTLPANTKFVPADDTSKPVSGGGGSREVNNNSKSVPGEQVSVISGSNNTTVSGKPVEYKIPSLISSHFGGHRGRGGAASRSTSQDNQAGPQSETIGPQASATAPKPTPSDTSVSTTRATQPSSLPQISDLGSSSQFTTNSGVKGPRPFAKSGLPKWPPEPKDKEEQAGKQPVAPHQPQINIFDEERQAGSGQSSPASSEGSGPLVKQGSGVFTQNQPPVPSLSQQFHYGSGPATPQKTGHSVNRQGPPPPPRMPQGTAAVRPVLVKTEQETKAAAQASASSNEADSSKLSINDSVSLGQPQAASTPNSSGLAQPAEGVDSTDGKAASGIHLNQRPAPTYRYASKNVIANTYMGRLGSAAMERYQQLNKLYNTDSLKKQAQGTPTAATSQGSASTASELRTAFTNGQQSSTDSVGEVSTGLTHFGLVGSPNYPDIASDKGSYKANTPKHIRRRHSDSDNEELNKALQRTEKAPAQTVLENVTEDNLNNNDANSGGGVAPAPATTQLSGTSVSAQPTASDTGIVNTDLTPALPDIADKRTVAVVRRKKTILKGDNGRKSINRVSFDPLALLLDASLEGELELVKRTAAEVDDVSAPNDEGITALHNAICAGHYDIVKFLVEFGADVNSPDSDGWTPLHCAASCNNLPMVRFLVEHGACIFAATISDNETAAEKCEEDEDGYDGCSDYLYSVQEKLGIVNDGAVYAVFDFSAHNKDELSFHINDKLTVLRKGDESEKEWWWARGVIGAEGYIPRNMLGLYARVLPANYKGQDTSEC